MVVLGGHDMWRLDAENGKIGLYDAIWRPTPRNMWWLIPTTCFAENGDVGRFSVGHSPTHALDEMIRHVAGKEKYMLLMSGLGDASQKQYFRFWVRWMTFQLWRGKAPWMNPQMEGRGEELSDWILYANKVVGIPASAIQGSISALRNMHLVCGKADFAKSGSRFKRFLKAINLKSAPKAKSPFPFELVRELSELSTNPLRDDVLEESIVAIGAAFPFLLRVGELGKLRWRYARRKRRRNSICYGVYLPIEY